MQVDRTSNAHCDTYCQKYNIGASSEAQYNVFLDSFSERPNILKCVLQNGREVILIAKILVETKFFRNGSKAAHLVDIARLTNNVSAESLRNFFDCLKTKLSELGCYKIITSCDKEKIDFFESNGYKLSECHMLHCTDSAKQDQTQLEALTEKPKYPKCRPLKLKDFKLGFVEVLSALRKVDNTPEKNELLFNERNNQQINTYVLIEKTEKVKHIVATASMILTDGMNANKKALIEDVAVKGSLQGKGFGKIIVNKVTQEAHSSGYDDVEIDCSGDHTVFYKKCGYTEDGVQMRCDL
jgi:N-acetylglutamate synthase-like GNAT family acetyltransferase